MSYLSVSVTLFPQQTKVKAIENPCLNNIHEINNKLLKDREQRTKDS